MSLERQKMHGGKILEFAFKNHRPVEYFTDFSASINPFGSDKGLKKFLENSISLIEHYPNEDYSEIKKLISQRHNVSIDNIYIGNGANSIIFRFFQAFKKILNICIPVPSFESYRLGAEAIFSNIIYYHMPNMKITGSIFEILSNNIDVLILTNPNNPTGLLIAPELLNEIIEYCNAKDIFILLDECFLDFVENGKEYSQIKKISGYRNIAVLRSLTKLYAFPGLRFGYLLLNNDKVKTMLEKLTPSWEINTLALEAAKYSLRQNMDKVISEILKEKSVLEDKLNTLGIIVYPSAANFLFCKYKKNLSQSLMQKGIIVRDCSDFIDLNNKYFRVAVKTNIENEKLVNTIKSLIEVENNV